MSKEPESINNPDYPNLDPDYSNLLDLLDKKDLKKISDDLIAYALDKKTASYEKITIEIDVPTSMIRLLDSLSKIFNFDNKLILSSMATQGLNNLIQNAVIQGGEKHYETTTKKKESPLDDLKPMAEISEQLNELKEVMSKFSEMKNISNLSIEDLIQKSKN